MEKKIDRIKNNIQAFVDGIEKTKPFSDETHSTDYVTLNIAGDTIGIVFIHPDNSGIKDKLHLSQLEEYLKLYNSCEKLYQKQ